VGRTDLIVDFTHATRHGAPRRGGPPARSGCAHRDRRRVPSQVVAYGLHLPASRGT